MYVGARLGGLVFDAGSGRIYLAMSVRVVRYVERPELWEEADAVSSAVWPEYNRHGDVLNRYWGRLFEDFPEFQFALCDEQDEVLAEGHTIPCAWDGTSEGLGDGIDAMIAGAFELRKADGEPTALGALAAEILPAFQGRGLADRVLDAMADLAPWCRALQPARDGGPSLRTAIRSLRSSATWPGHWKTGSLSTPGYAST